jgi:pimeloyl-ACP methyl ester carboxylesterase
MQKEIWDRLADKSGSLADLADRMFFILFPARWLASHDPWKYCPEVHETTSEEITARQAEAFFGWTGSYDRLPEIRVPVLVVTGTDDIVIPPENSRILASRIPGARLEEIPGAGHGMQYQCPRKFADTVIEFLQGR